MVTLGHLKARKIDQSPPLARREFTSYARYMLIEISMG